MQKGWIKLHRKLLDNPLFKFPNYTLVWMYLLLNATHSECDVIFEGKRITLRPGQLTCGANQIAKQMGVTRSSVERALGRFKVEEMVEVQTSNKCSLISVKNWSLYQCPEEVAEEQTRNKRGASEEQVNTKQEGDNVDNEKNVKKPIPATSEDVADTKEVNEVLSAFQMKLNPNIKYGNKTQRQAARELLKKLGRDKLLRTIDYVEKISAEQFAPTITTPYQLQEKMAQLTAYFNKNSAPKNTIAIIS